MTCWNRLLCFGGFYSDNTGVDVCPGGVWLMFGCSCLRDPVENREYLSLCQRNIKLFHCLCNCTPLNFINLIEIHLNYLKLCQILLLLYSCRSSSPWPLEGSAVSFICEFKYVLLQVNLLKCFIYRLSTEKYQLKLLILFKKCAAGRNTVTNFTK